MFDENGMLKTRFLQQQEEAKKGMHKGYTICSTCGKKYSLHPVGCYNKEHATYYATKK